MKKIAGTLILAVSLIAGICLIFCSDKGIKYSECQVNENHFQQIRSGRREASGLLEELCFDGQKLMFDSMDKTFYYSIPEDISGAYDPSVSVKSPYKGVRIAFLDGGISPDSIKSNQSAAFLVYTDNAYAEYKLICTTLPLMNIECASEIGDASVPMKMTLYDNRPGAQAQVTVSQGGIHVRGNTTRIFPKKGYRFSLTTVSEGGHVRANQISLLGMRQDDDWLLYPAYNDQEKIRNVFSSNLWKYSCAADNAMGVDAGMEYKYLELFLNGRYWGLYALGYPIDEKQLMLDPSCMDETLYKGVSWYTDGQISFSEGGGVNGFRIAENEKAAAANWKPFLDYAFYVEENRENNEALYAGIDLDNAIDIYLFLNLIQGMDHAMGGKNIKNLYLAIREGEGGPTALYVPWDMDVTWGNGWVNDASVNLTVPYGVPSSSHVLLHSGCLNQLLVNDAEGIWEKIFTKYRELRQTGWSEENVCAMLEEYEADIYGSGAYLREMARWPDGTYDDAEAGLEFFQEYVLERLKQMDLYYNGLEQTRDEGRSGYELKLQFNTFKSPVFYLQALAFADYEAVIEINDPGIWDDPVYAKLFAGLEEKGYEVYTDDTVMEKYGVLRNGDADMRIVLFDSANGEKVDDAAFFFGREGGEAAVVHYMP